MKKPLILNTLFAFLILITACSKRSDFEIRNDKIRSLIKVGSDSINSKTFFPDRDVRNYLHTEFNEFYEARDYNLAWLDFMNPEDQADELLEALDDAANHGLDPDNYDTEEIEALLAKLYNIESKKERRKKWRKKLVKSKKFKEQLQEEDTARFQDIAKLDFILTASYLTYGSHLLSGRIDPNEKEEWFAPRREKDLSEHLENALSGDIKESLEELAPVNTQYTKLKDYLTHFNTLTDIDVPVITKTLKSGDNSEDVYNAKRRLAFWKNIKIDKGDSSKFDENMVEAVKMFQKMNDLENTGEVDKATLAVLNQSFVHWTGKIKTNMERMRWLNQDFGDEYILVNIPAYSLSVVKKDKEELGMKVIVGTNYKKTPVFSDTLEYLVFNPTWTVPDEIAVEEMLPRLRNEEDYLVKRNFKLYEGWDRNAEPIEQADIDWNEINEDNWNYRIVEAPGPKNSLGLVKFMMPNSEFIYLHDTPADYLFNKKERSFSHGCIRLERPFALAEYLLDWDKSQIDEQLKLEETNNVVLKKKVPVNIVYWSAWVDGDDMINLRDDIYNYDSKQEKEINLKEKTLASAAPIN